MKIYKIIFYSFLNLVLLIGCSGSSKIGRKICSEPWVKYFTCYPSHVTLMYDSEIYYTADSEKTYPKPFKIDLPNKILSFKFIGSEDFIFYYRRNQAIYIKIDLEGATSNLDTIYIPTKTQIEDILDKADIDIGIILYQQISEKYNRKFLVIEKQSATILLFNILKDNIDRYSNLVKGIEFIY